MEALSLTTASTSPTNSVLSEILEDAHVDTKDCYQCGKCSAGCPVATFADLTPREILRNLQLGAVDTVLSSRMPWLCLGCGMCLARCPQSVDLPNLMSACRKKAQQQGTVPIKEVEKFNALFIDGVHAKGVSDEAELAMKYNMTTGHLFQDALGAPKMLAYGMINTNSHELENPEEVQAIIDRVRAIEGTTQKSSDTASEENATGTKREKFSLASLFKKGGN